MASFASVHHQAWRMQAAWTKRTLKFKTYLKSFMNIFDDGLSFQLFLLIISCIILIALNSLPPSSSLDSSSLSYVISVQAQLTLG